MSGQTQHISLDLSGKKSGTGATYIQYVHSLTIPDKNIANIRNFDPVKWTIHLSAMTFFNKSVLLNEGFN